MLTFVRDITNSTGSFSAACSDSSYLYTTDNNTDVYRQFNWNGAQINSISLSVAPSGIALIGNASAVISYYGGNRVSYIDIGSNGKTDVTTNALSTYGLGVQGQQIDSDKINHTAMATSSTNSKITLINVNFTLTTLQPTAMTGAQASCIIHKPNTANYIVGTNNGKVFETDTSGNVIKTINLPNTPNIAAPTIVVCGLSYYNDMLAVLTTHGLLYIYKYSTSANVGEYGVGASGAVPNGSLSGCASGSFLLNIGASILNATMSLVECYSASGNTSFNALFNDTSGYSFFASGYETSLGLVWAITVNSGVSDPKLRIFSTTGTLITYVPVRGQNPPGIDVSSRIIRLRDDGVGRLVVEFDGILPSGAQPNVPCTMGRQYIELSEIQGTPPGLPWDIGEFQA